MRFNLTTHRPWQRYLVAILAFTVAVAVSVELIGILDTRSTYITFFPAVIIAALYSGVPAGLLVTFLSTIYVSYWLEPVGQIFNVHNASDRIAMAIFTMSCVMICFVVKALHFSQKQASEAEAETKLAEQRRLNEAKLQESESRFRSLFENSIDAIFLTIPDGKITAANPAACTIFGMTEEEICRVGRAGIVDQDDPGLPAALKERCDSGKVVCELTCVRKDGTKFPAEVSSVVMDNARSSFVILRDITKRKRAEAEREQFFTFFICSADLMCIADPNGAFMRTNPACLATLGYSEAELVSKPFIDFVHPDDKQRTLDEMKRQLEIGHSINFENRYIRKDGSLCWLSWRAIYNKDDHFTYATARDISDRKLMETQLRASEAHYRLLTEDVADVVWKLDSNYRFTYISPADERLRGYKADEVIGRTIFELCDRDSAITEIIRQRQEAEAHGTPAGPATFEVQQRCRDGRMIWTEIHSTPERDAHGSIIGFHGITRDITVRKLAAKLEHQLLHAQKLESLGVLAGGIAHDFNNILMAIIGNASLATMRINQDSPAVENLHKIEQAAARAADLTKQMLAYSGKGKFVVEILDLNQLLENMLNLLEVSISKKAILRLNLHQPLPPVEVDATQIRQIVMNLVINASEAIEDDNGTITITTGFMDCNRDYLNNVWLDENINEGLYVYLEVEDTGCGMGKETLAKLFDPFFTTKFAGRGLGMAAVLGIVKGHKGAIKVHSEPGKGSTFKILLPASDRPVDQLNHGSQMDDWHGSGTVLLVDDEESVRSTGAEMLRELGFRPVTANNGLEAISIFKETPGIAFVILDLTMPRMDGEQCFRELRSLDPTVKVIMSSGYNEQEVAHKFVGKGLCGFIQKPYNLSVLRDEIKRVS